MPNVDLILSSGFMAFSRHLGFLQAVERMDCQVDAVVGTSSGALVGAMWWSGIRLDHVSRLLTMQRPVQRIGWHPRFWQGPFTMAPLIDQLRAILPSTFEGLGRPFAVGVTDHQGRYRLLTSGPLPEAVAASCAIPRLFRPVNIGGAVYIDGGATDRLGLNAWREWRGLERQALVHEVQSRFGVARLGDLGGCTLIKTPRANANFLSLGDFDGQAREACEAALATIAHRPVSGVRPYVSAR